ncbi:uncharacterized protein LOC142985138 isoform X2 [Anticarsia gemmatalis]|uniref:uncharacterized protein LOC142985138 isoform X2 n=1 Tax=Anticarsia gemmatalis TaxID=129554 RepID=UPI003F767D82
MAAGNSEINTYFGKCRCCLNYGYLKNMWEEHYWEGEKEIYVEMLVQCFGLSWQHSEDSMENDQICESCINRLREANNFKKTVLDSQERLLEQADEDSLKPDTKFLIDNSQDEHDSESAADDNMFIDDPDDPNYVDPDDPADPDDPNIKYEDVEYLEEEDDKTAGADAPRRRSKTPAVIPPDSKWPRKLPKADRYKTYKRYTEEALRKCLEAVRNQELTPTQASEKFNVPKKTIIAKVRSNPKGVRESAKQPWQNQRANNRDIPSQIKENSDILAKNIHNLTQILEYSNATMIKTNIFNKYCCHFCEKRFYNPKDLKTHNFFHKNVSKPCKTKYLANLIIKIDITNLQCNLCPEIHTFNILKDFLQHLKGIHKKVIHDTIKDYIIPFKFDTEKLKCCVCGQEFKHFKLLSEHMCEHYRNYECVVCTRPFINKQSWQIHTYRHKTGQFKCSKCPKIFDSKPKRSDHERVTHKLLSKKRKCRYCDEKFASKTAVEKHEVSHGVARPIYICTVCEKVCNTQQTLWAHKKRCHLLERKFKCDYCLKDFFSKSELILHIVSHTKTKEFSCDWCDSVFGTKAGLNQHMRAHLDDRRYKCNQCGNAFVHLSTWKRHMRSQHKEKL